MRQEIQIDTENGYTIYGTLDTEQNNSLVIFVHGLTGEQYEHQYFNAVPFFLNRGVDTFRFDFYARRKPNARPLHEHSIGTHVADLQKITNYFKEHYQELILVGHSFGCLIILHTDISFLSKVIFRDPAGEIKNIEEKHGEYNANIDKYILHRGIDMLVGKQLIDDWKNIKLSALIIKFCIPCKFIFAGAYDKQEQRIPYINEFKTTVDSVSIPYATHRFIEEHVLQHLYEETRKWIEKSHEDKS